jgi:hypothetical protein
MVVCPDPWNMDSASGLYLAEVRDFHMTEKELPVGQRGAEHRGDPKKDRT